MKRICLILLLVLCMTGCKHISEVRPDTIVDIPVRPTESMPQTAAEMTEAATEPMTRPPAPEVPGGEDTPGVTEPAGSVIPPDDNGGKDCEIADAINAVRLAAGLGPLTPESRLCAIASVRARENAVRWGYLRPDGSDGITVLGEYGYGYSCAAEILWFGDDTAEKIVSGWMGSGIHKAKILMEAVYIGVAGHTGDNGVTYWAVLIVG